MNLKLKLFEKKPDHMEIQYWMTRKDGTVIEFQAPKTVEGVSFKHPQFPGCAYMKPTNTDIRLVKIGGVWWRLAIYLENHPNPLPVNAALPTGLSVRHLDMLVGGIVVSAWKAALLSVDQANKTLQIITMISSIVAGAASIFGYLAIKHII